MWLVPLAREVSCYFFFFAGAFLVAFLAVAFLVAFFIEKILPKRKICNPYRSQCDSYIRFFATEVKKKIKTRPLEDGQRENSGVKTREGDFVLLLIPRFYVSV